MAGNLLYEATSNFKTLNDRDMIVMSKKFNDECIDYFHNKICMSFINIYKIYSLICLFSLLTSNYRNNYFLVLLNKATHF